MTRIDEFFDLTVDLEGGFSDRASDRGGKTKYGITQYTLNIYNSNNYLDAEIVNELSVDKAKTIYTEFYYNTIHYLENEEIHFNCIDLAYNSGHKHYTEMLGALGDNFMPDDVYAWRTNFYTSLNQPANLDGWLNRLTRIKDHFNPS